MSREDERIVPKPESLVSRFYERKVPHVRVCGDRPFIDPNSYKIMIEQHIKNKNDLTTNIFPRTVPQGLSCEVVSTRSLEKILDKKANAITKLS